jgi:nucleoside phosphorylase
MEDRAKRAVPVDVGIVTIKDEELRAVLDVFPRSEGVFVGRSGRHYNLRIADAGGGRTYRLAIVRLVEQGNGEAQAAARDLIDDVKPALVLVVGIAGGVPGSDLTLGDVVISTRINDYTVHQASQGGAREFAIGGGPVAFRVAAGVANLATRDDALRGWTDELPPRPPLEPDDAAVGGPADWQERVRTSLIHHFRTQPRSAPRFLDGALGSSDGLIKDVDLLVGWLATARNLRAVEMESAGVYHATRDRCAMLAIRGISDLVGLKRDERWTHYACATAAVFTRAYLATTPVPPGAGSDLHNEMGIASAAISDEKLDCLTDKEVEADVLTSSRRRCCICTAIRGDWGEKHGRIAHLDRNRDSNDLDNLAFLCFEHHNQYDTRTNQSKGFTLTEVKRYRAELISSLRSAVALPVESHASGGAGPIPLNLAPEWVGVLHGSHVLFPPMKELLLFDRVAVVGLEHILQLHRFSLHGEPDIADQLEKLEQFGLLFRTNGVSPEYMDNVTDPGLRLEGHLALIALQSIVPLEGDESTPHGIVAKILRKNCRKHATSLRHLSSRGRSFRG